MASDDTEITLGVGKLLGLFFLLAAICGIFFSIGYSLGKSSGREQALNDQPASTTVSADTGSPTSGNPKPSAARSAKPDSQAPASDESSSGGDQQKSLTFYNAVRQNDNAAPGTTAPAQAAPEKRAPAAKLVAAAATPPATATKAELTPAAHAADVISHTSPVTGPGTIVVQIAAVSREDDAVALAGALRKKNYNVFVVNNPVTNDKFYHVQVGPFSTLAEAEAMKAKLVAEGYNPILKR
ncbi:MAG TPA: SPOR domain-containing protein [Terriglobales bacterium]|jgi:cell division septation protein DedD